MSAGGGYCMPRILYVVPVLAVLAVMAVLPAAHAQQDTTPPTMVSATIDSDSQTLTVLFDEPVVVDPVASVVFLFNNADVIRGTLTVESTRITVALTDEEVDGYGDGDSVTVIPDTVL